MLAVWLTSWPAKSMGSPMIPRIRYAVAATSISLPDIAHQDHELVAPEPGREVVRPDAGADAVRDGGEHPVAAGVTQEVVHDLEAVQVEEEDGRLPVGGQADLQLPEEGAAVGQPGQVVVEGDVLGPLLGVDAGLELDEHGGDGLQGADLLGRPAVEPEVEEAQDTPGGVGQQEGHARPADQLHVARRALFHPVQIVVLVRPGQVGRAQVPGRREHGVGVEGHLAEGIRVGNVLAGRPFGFQDAQTPLVVVAPQERHVRAQEFGEHARRPGQHVMTGP